MKTFMFIIFVIFLFSLVSCSTSNIGRQCNYMKPNTSINNNFGYLMVFTDKDEEKGSYAEDPLVEVYKGYCIYSQDGNFVREVEKSYQVPEQVRLEEGEYVVVAELYKNFLQSFIVTIEKGKLLEIDKSMVKNPLAMN